MSLPRRTDSRADLGTHRGEVCVHWDGLISGYGYGRFTTYSVDGPRTSKLAHIVAYENGIGPVPKGLVIDHTCHTADRDCPGGVGCMHRRCINVDHMELVEAGENTQRGFSRASGLDHKLYCVNGHPWTEENTYRSKARNGHKQCRECVRIAVRKSSEKQKRNSD